MWLLTILDDFIFILFLYVEYDPDLSQNLISYFFGQAVAI